MNNKVAAPCCGSCEHWDYDLCDGGYCTAEEMQPQPDPKYEILCDSPPATNCDYRCQGKYYSPYNPISIIDIPGVKELVAKAFRDGMRWDPEDFSDDKLDYDTFENNSTKEYMKALEDKR